MKHYYSLNDYLQKEYGEKVYKLALNGAMTCPNRDGRIDTRGCIFCSAGGSGDFAASPQLSIPEQIEAGKKLLSKKYSGSRYIAYFQAYTNTYADISYLKKIYMEALLQPDIVCISIATRPDCLSEPVMDLLRECNAIKPVWIELGLQTIHKVTADYIRRGYELEIFDEAVLRLHAAGIKTVVHMILGLPGESREDMKQTAAYIASKHVFGIKLQLLHVLSGTDLAADYAHGLFSVMTLEEYIDTLMEIIEILPPDMVIHRLTGDGPKNLLIAPMWSANKRNVLNSINKAFDSNHICQGRLFHREREPYGN
jgi:hypothetical protein